MPPGCTGLDMADGSRLNADRNGLVNVDDRHATVLNKSWYARTGVMTAREPHVFGTKGTARCTNCTPSRAWNAWTTQCPRCGAPTHLEEQQ
jgi:hypothetical protein